MRYIDEFRDPHLAAALTTEIAGMMRRLPYTADRPLAIMELCGGHTHAIFRYGIEGMLPPSIELIHGPGCPVCVLPMGRVDDAVAIAEQPGVIFTTFGDAMRVPGSRKSLLQAKADGADVRMVYSPMDALALATANPRRAVVFFALGFETTMPSTALTVLRASEEGVGNFSLFCNHITIVPTIRMLLADPQSRLDAFIGPGHVSLVIGTTPYDFIAADHGKPVVVAGFEPLDILQSIWMVVKQLCGRRAVVENQYNRFVTATGNAAAQEAVHRVYAIRDLFEWRGLGAIEGGGVVLRPEFAAFDAERRYPTPGTAVADPDGCQCSEVLTGTLKPWQCRMFETVCRPDNPLGALMVSSEGSCAAYYQYGGVRAAIAS